MLDHILKFMTLGTLIVSSVAIYTALHTNNRRLGADIFLKYADRISKLRRSLPTFAFFEGDVSGNTEMTAEERRAAHEMIHSIFELYELKVPRSTGDLEDQGARHGKTSFAAGLSAEIGGVARPVCETPALCGVDRTDHAEGVGWTGALLQAALVRLP